MLINCCVNVHRLDLYYHHKSLSDSQATQHLYRTHPSWMDTRGTGVPYYSDFPVVTTLFNPLIDQPVEVFNQSCTHQLYTSIHSALNTHVHPGRTPASAPVVY